MRVNRENWSPVWLALIGTLGWNYFRHRADKSTLCQSREDVPPGVMAAALLALIGWLIPHYERRRGL